MEAFYLVSVGVPPIFSQYLMLSMSNTFKSGTIETMMQLESLGGKFVRIKTRSNYFCPGSNRVETI